MWKNPSTPVREFNCADPVTVERSSALRAVVVDDRRSPGWLLDPTPDAWVTYRSLPTHVAAATFGAMPRTELMPIESTATTSATDTEPKGGRDDDDDDPDPNAGRGRG